MKPTVAIVGASPKRDKFGNKAVRAYLKAGYEVYPVHPAAEEVEGQKVYRTLADTPAERFDRVTFYLPKEAGLKALDQMGDKAVGQLVLNPGADDDEVVQKAKDQGLTVVVGCSIMMGGYKPDDFPDE